ncbi:MULTISPECIES: glutathione S-transferase family protein [unclassified Paenibacillus]|uniref:glutathione S-transferase family protein n=1 Tax=unclassified Paenibacillus TaxID=185978 RepID=UPI000838AF2D|nr:MULTISPECIES: glutathione S-transferase C-terminal domain-containing protein [unclassified Paenibacillus]NWL86654.1 glutathione-dependent reductase [Paenibacillus sp. 79R4]
MTTKSAEIENNGSFKRQSNRFVTPFGDQDGELPVEANRYRLLWAPVCPWAHRAMIARKLLGLEEAISVGTADPLRPRIDRVDWAFTWDDNDVDPVLGVHYISEVYLNADPEYAGRPTVPAIVDIASKQVVNNDYHELTYYLETVWKPFHKEGAPDLFPEALQRDIRELNERIFHGINNGVYKAGFARSQEAYEQAYDGVFELLDELEARLDSQRYLFGNRITDADIRLYVTLARFDIAYYTAFRVNRNRLVEFPNLWAYARDLYQTPGFGDTTDFAAIKKHYHLSITHDPNYTFSRLLPKGPDLSGWLTDHGRAERFK